MAKGSEKKRSKASNKRRKSGVLVGSSDWDEAEINVHKPCNTRGNIVKWSLAVSAVLALMVAVYALINRDRELLGQVWELSKHLLSLVLGWAIGATAHR